MNIFKSLLKNWNDNSCNCLVCTKKIYSLVFFSVIDFKNIYLNLILHKNFAVVFGKDVFC